jgi:P2-related tail formation protein
MTSGRGPSSDRWPSSLLPPNATDFERILEDITKFNIQTNQLKGFKFKENQIIVRHLIWEFSLNDVLKYIQNNSDIIKNGLAFQRTRGTREAVKIAANWADLDDVDVYEEEPSSHFYEFQIGVKNRQFDFDIELLKNVIDLAKPVRSRLSRVYNDIYDVRYFKLGHSEFGDILSDNFGAKLGDLTVSFGRKSWEPSSYDDVTANSCAIRVHEIKSATDRICRLDFMILDETEPDVNAIAIEYQKVRVYESMAYDLGNLADIDKHITFAKAAIILSESSVLDAINTCFNTLTIIEEDTTFMLGIDVLSDHLWGFETVEILERFARETPRYADFSGTEYFCTNPVVERNFARVIPAACLANLGSSRATTINSNYETNKYWSEHKRPEKPWNDEIYVTKLHQPPL